MPVTELPGLKKTKIFFNNTNLLTINRIFASLERSFLLQPSDNRKFNMAFTKHDIVDQIQNQLGIPRNVSIDVTEGLLEIIKATLAAGEDVLVSGFGKFCVKEKQERKGRNPATGEDLMLKPRQVVTFKCSGLLRNKVNGK
jgi:integration host factor subunit alpha